MAQGRPRVRVGPSGQDASSSPDAVWCRTLAALGVTGAADEVVRVPPRTGSPRRCVVVTGLGDEKRTYDAETLRRAAGAAARGLAGTGPRRCSASRPATPTRSRPSRPGRCSARTRSPAFRGRTADQAKPGVTAFVLAAAGAPTRRRRAALARGRAVAEAMCLARDLVNTPPNTLTPAAFAGPRGGRGQGSRPRGLTVLDEKALRKGGYGGILGVGQGSANPPRLVRLAYRRPRRTRHLALVGKGITFDSGGISIKPAAGMDAMKSDMGGAAAVLGAMVAVARLKPAVDVTGWLPLAENMPGGGGAAPRRRPDDVRRPDRRGAEHRRRGPAGARRRAGRARPRTTPT